MHGYGMIKGKNGVSGYVRKTEDGRRIFLRGLPEDAPCTLYRLENGEGIPWTEGSGGSMEALLREEGMVFAAVQGRVVAWEEAAGDPGYFAACRAMEKWISPRDEPELPAPEAALPVAEETPLEEEDKAYALRERGVGEAVDGLPALIWPEPARALRPFFEKCPPVQPFHAPGWRFVRAPSPAHGLAYCLLGRRMEENRVTEIAYALPGHPQHPPLPLAGYRYQPGQNGQGYWVYVQKT